MPAPKNYPDLQSLKDSPPQTMICYADVEHMLFGTTRKQVEAAVTLGRVGTLVGVRMTQKTPMHFRAGDMATYIAERMALLEQAQ